MRTMQRILMATGLLWSCLWLGLSAQSVSPLPAPVDPAVEAAARAARASGQVTPAAPARLSASTQGAASAKPAAGPTAVSAIPQSYLVKPATDPALKPVVEEKKVVSTPVVQAEEAEEMAATPEAAALDKNLPQFVDTGHPESDAKLYYNMLMDYYKMHPPTDAETQLKLKLAEERKAIDAQNKIDQQ